MKDVNRIASVCMSCNCHEYLANRLHDCKLRDPEDRYRWGDSWAKSELLLIPVIKQCKRRAEHIVLGQGWYVYLVECSDRSIYCGITTCPGRRLWQHNQGTASKCTRARRPVKMIYAKRYETQSEALKVEAKIKKWPPAHKRALTKTKHDLA